MVLTALTDCGESRAENTWRKAKHKAAGSERTLEKRREDKLSIDDERRAQMCIDTIPNDADNKTFSGQHTKSA